VCVFVDKTTNAVLHVHIQHCHVAYRHITISNRTTTTHICTIATNTRTNTATGHRDLATPRTRTQGLSTTPVYGERAVFTVFGHPSRRRPLFFRIPRIVLDVGMSLSPCVCVYICMCVCVCLSLSLCVCMYICMYVCMYVCT